MWDLVVCKGSMKMRINDNLSANRTSTEEFLAWPPQSFHSLWKHFFSVFSSSAWELLSPKEKMVLLRKKDDGEFWYLTRGPGTNALPGWHLVTHPANICRVPHVCQASPIQRLKRSLWGSQSSRANSPCKHTVTISVTRAVITGPEISRCSEKGVGVTTSSPTSALLLCHSVHSISRFCLSWLRKDMRKEGTAKSCQTISHLICALQSQIALLPLTPRPLTSYCEGSPSFWLADRRPFCSPLPLLFTLTVNIHSVLRSPLLHCPSIPIGCRPLSLLK